MSGWTREGESHTVPCLLAMLPAMLPCNTLRWLLKFWHACVRLCYPAAALGQCVAADWAGAWKSLELAS